MSQQQWGNSANPAQRAWGQQPPQWQWGAPAGQPWGQQASWPGQPWSGQPQQQGWPQPPRQQQWPQAPQQGYNVPQQRGGYSPQPPRRRRSFLGTLVRIGLLVVGIMFAVSLLRGFLGSTTPSDPTSPTRTDPPVNAPYVNEDYQAPPADMSPGELPYPETVSEAEAYLTDNPLYQQSIPAPTNCRMGAVDPNTAGKEVLETHLNELMACLMTVWEQPVKAAGFEMPRPPVYVYTSPIRTACGVMKEVNAAYCAGDQRVYYAKPLLQAFPQKVRTTKYAAEMVIAHEFGHAIQARTGILISDKALEQRATKNEALVMSRRTETQADCFSALYVRSVAQSQGLTDTDLQGLVEVAYNLGDDVLSGDPSINEGHGLGRSRQAWFTTGLGSNQISVCNTWTAPASSVR